MEFYTKQKVVGIFVLALEHQGYTHAESVMMIQERGYLVEDVIAVQSDFVKMFNGVHSDIKQSLYTQDQLKRLISRVINKKLDEMLKFPNRIEER